MAAQHKSSKAKPQHLGLPVPKSILLAIGGKESKSEDERPESQKENNSFISEEILKRFVKELKGTKPMILVVPAASSDPVPVTREYKKLFKSLRVDNIKVADIATREDAKAPELIELVDKAAGIMLTGGDQLRLTSILGGSPFLERIKTLYQREVGSGRN
ncbi:cyanophycinase [Pontibacter burrus]|uniref:cyanophycinase n=1 Tax=Pontibacter burrus TaxID=2704466 RepID=UPI001F406F1C|nr:Type 1 glutamine amidotransferase-like domain-containing protein [Pontibacter burrus]